MLSLKHRRANRQYIAMRDNELWSFIDSQKKLYVAFPMENGYPHVSPIWFCVLDKKLYLRTQDYKVKTQLARNGKACCTLDEGQAYRTLRGVIIWGSSRVLTEQPLIERIEKIMRM